jgi:alkyl hydroperoxide reductase subunit F
VSARFDGTDARKPSFAIRADEGRAEAVFAGLPMGHEFTSLILALLHVGGHPPKEDADLLDQGARWKGRHFETFFSLTCQNCPDVVQALNIMAALNPNVTHVAIDGAVFQDEVERRKIMAVPTVFLNGEPFGSGRMDLAQIVAKLDTGSAARAAEKIAAKEPFDVLVVGGGPPARRRRSTPRARASAPASSPNASAGRCSIPWRSRTSSRCRTPKGRSWPRISNSTSRNTTWT